MRARSRILQGTVCVLLGVLSARAQTAVWTGGGGANENFSNGANWLAGMPPPNDGSNTVDLTPATDATIIINTNASIAGLFFQGTTGTNQYVLNDGGGVLSIGSGGISKASPVNANLYFSANIVLTANQVWDMPFINQEGGVISGNFSISTTGSAFIFGENTFTGGLNVLSGTFSLGSGTSAGTGTITLSDNSSLDTFFSPDSLANNVVVGDNVTFGTAATSALTLTGPVSFVNASTTLNLGSNTQVILTGLLSGPPSTQLVISGENNSSLPVDGGSQLVVQGALSQISGLSVSNTQVILAPVTTDPATSYASLSPSGLQVVNGGYLGLDGSFATKPGAVAAFISTYAPSMGPNFNGTLGFDTFANPTVPQTFSDPIDLSSFSGGGFVGLGSATSAILSGPITPAPFDTFTYPFGGGGGTLIVTSDLEDVGGSQLVMNAGQAPLTVILQGRNDYTNPVLSNGGVLIFDSTVLPAGGIFLQGGYVGYTETAALSSNAFIALFSSFGTGVVGFDQHTPNVSSPRLVGDAIDMSYFNSDSLIFIGTSTAVDFTSSAVITPGNNNQYMFTGVKGGNLTVDTQLTDNGNSIGLTIGLVNPVESNGTTSVVNLTGNNTFSGGTTFNSGTLFISSGTAFGTGTLTIPDTPGTNISPYLASFGGNPVTVMNPIFVGSRGSSQGVSLGNISPSGNDMLILGGVISDEVSPFTLPGMIGINGPVTLTGNNTYTGGTIFTGIGNAEALINNSSAFGTGSIDIQDGATIAALGADVAFSNPITLTQSPLNLGQTGSAFLLTLNGIISGGGTLNISSNVALNGANSYTGNTVINSASVTIGSATPFGTSTVTLQNGSSLQFSMNPTFTDLTGDATNSVNLNTGQTLTLDADTAGGNYSGAINGDGTTSVIKIDTGVQQLSGISSYAGGTTVSAGILIVGNNTALGTGPVTVAGGATLGLSNGTTFSLPITLSGNSTLSGNGTFAPLAPIVFDNNNTVMAGNAISGQYIATLSFATPLTFGSGGIYSFNVTDANGAQGVGYSTIATTGALTITATGGGFTILVNSIDSGGGPGLATFNPMVPYSWTILSASSIPTFSSSDFTVITTGFFQNSLAGGTFAVGESGSTLTLDFTPVPEPSTWLLMLSGLAATGACLRQRKRASARSL